MRLNCCLTILHVSILAALLVHLEADKFVSGSRGPKAEERSNHKGEDCEVVIRVRRSTVYKASVGEELRINCTVVFCNNSPPTVSWIKRGETYVPVNVSSSSHIKTDWKKIDDSRGMSFLVFKKILMSDSGEYRCQGGGSVSHIINVSVSGNRENTNITHKNDSNVLDYDVFLEPHDTRLGFPPYAFRIVGIVLLVIVVLIIYVASRSGCKVQGVRCPRRSRETPEPSFRHIYENDPNVP